MATMFDPVHSGSILEETLSYLKIRPFLLEISAFPQILWNRFFAAKVPSHLQ